MQVQKDLNIISEHYKYHYQMANKDRFLCEDKIQLINSEGMIEIEN